VYGGLTILLYVMYYSVFDGNTAADGSAINIAFYSTKFDTVTFSNNRESAVRVGYEVMYMLVYILVVFVGHSCVRVF